MKQVAWLVVGVAIWVGFFVAGIYVESGNQRALNDKYSAQFVDVSVKNQALRDRLENCFDWRSRTVPPDGGHTE